MAKWKFEEWLLFWIISTKEFSFEWDSGNISKNKDKHNISTKEAESVFILGQALPLGVEINVPDARSELRLGIIGKDLNGIVLQIAFVIRKKKIRIISARPANKKERVQYEEGIRKIFKTL
jgi:uncharacterized DUF497 family protein